MRLESGETWNVASNSESRDVWGPATACRVRSAYAGRMASANPRPGIVLVFCSPVEMTSPAISARPCMPPRPTIRFVDTEPSHRSAAIPPSTAT